MKIGMPVFLSSTSTTKKKTRPPRLRKNQKNYVAAAAALTPCCCALCLSRTQLGRKAYKSYFASAMATMMQSYEAEVEPVKRALFAEALREAAAGTAGSGAGGEGSGSGGRGLDVLDLGCGALPNARLLLLGSGGSASPGSAPSSPRSPVAVRSLVGVDSNAFMFRYAQEAAREAGFEVLEPPSGGSNSGGSGSGSGGGSRGSGKDGAPSPSSSTSSSPSAPSSSFPQRPTARFVQASAESPASLSASGIRDESVDVVLCTLLLCSVPDPGQTLAAAAAALRPGGVIAFLEHTLDPEPTHGLMRVTQRVLDPLQQLLADGCHLTRDPVPLFEVGGGGGGGKGARLLRLSKVERFRVEGGGFIAPHVSGIAVKL